MTIWTCPCKTRRRRRTFVERERQGFRDSTHAFLQDQTPLGLRDQTPLWLRTAGQPRYRNTETLMPDALSSMPISYSCERDLTPIPPSLQALRREVLGLRS